MEDELRQNEYAVKPDQVPEQSLKLTFLNADTEELKNLEVMYHGDSAFFKVGEAECNHLQLPNDKKLLETQFMIIVRNGKYYIRDFGFVHTTRIKLDLNSDVQLHQDCVVDIGKIVHYHFDKLLHGSTPKTAEGPEFLMLRSEENRRYELDKDDFPYLRARPCWISPDEKEESVQNEINIFADGYKTNQSIGRSSKKDIQIKLKAVSAEHCQVAYEAERGWTISERGKPKTSSNGTFVFMKTLEQSKKRLPSDMVPLHDGMVISFVNYEVKVQMCQVSPEDHKGIDEAQKKYFSTRPKGMLGYRYATGDPVRKVTAVAAVAPTPG